MSNNRDLVEALRRATKTEVETSSKCTIVAGSIDLVNLVCDCAPINGNATIFNVEISVNKKEGFVLVPKDESLVNVTFTSNARAFISMVSEVESIVMKGDTFGGLIKIDNLKTQYDTNMNAIKAACVAAFTAQAGIDGGLGLAAFNAAATAIAPLNKIPLENTNIKHGNL